MNISILQFGRREREREAHAHKCHFAHKNRLCPSFVTNTLKHTSTFHWHIIHIHAQTHMNISDHIETKTNCLQCWYPPSEIFRNATHMKWQAHHWQKKYKTFRTHMTCAHNACDNNHIWPWRWTLINSRASPLLFRRSGGMLVTLNIHQLSALNSGARIYIPIFS